MSSSFIKRTKIATAIPKRQQKADTKTTYKVNDAFHKTRCPGGAHVPNSVNIMPIVNVNVNLNLGHKAPAGKRAGKEIVSSPHQVD